MSDEATWRTPVRAGEHGVVVRMGKPDNPYWWVLCPVSATLILDANYLGDDDCSDVDCLWGDIHADIAAVIREHAPTVVGGGS